MVGPPGPLNYTQLSLETGIDRPLVEAGIREIVTALNRAVADRQAILFDFEAVGRLSIQRRRIAFNFFQVCALCLLRFSGLSLPLADLCAHQEFEQNPVVLEARPSARWCLSNRQNVLGDLNRAENDPAAGDGGSGRPGSTGLPSVVGTSRHLETRRLSGAPSSPGAGSGVHLPPLTPDPESPTRVCLGLA
jgi:hypothetical protein